MPTPFVYPRPEYPRPDFQRGTIEGTDWLNLNGPWQFRFDPDRVGINEQWFKTGKPDWREQIIVPFCWESLAAWGEAETASNENYYSTRAFRNPLEVNRANHAYVARHEVGWYRRRLSIPSGAPWEGKRIILKIGAADFFTDAWCNGVHVGQHEGGYTPFEFDLTDAIPATNTAASSDILVVLRVEDPMGNHEQPVGKQWHWYTPTSGIWQTVYLEPRHASHIEHFRIHPDIDDRSARFEVHCQACPPGAELTLYVIPPGGEVQVLHLPVENNVVARTVPIQEPYLWNPNEPHLYKAAFKLHAGDKTLDYVQSYFGMRKIDAEPTADPKTPAVLRLNNVPRYLRGALYQSYFPDGVYTAGDVETIRQDILWAKRFGFNFLRVHIKIDDPLLLYYADSLGIMLMADFPNFGEGGNTPLGRRRFEEMMRAAIRRDFNHPSIIAWCVFNETWGFGGQAEFVKLFPDFKKKLLLPGAVREPVGTGAAAGVSASSAAAPSEPHARLANQESHAWVQKMWELAKHLDPTRLVEDMSVVQWEHLDYFAHGETDINSWHFYIDDYERAKEHIQKVVDATYTGSSYNFVPGFAGRGQPLINSEYGGIGALDGNRDGSWSFKFLTNELRRHRQISAYIYTELHDVEWEYNGFLTYDRTPKELGYDPRLINESDVLPIDYPPVSRHAPGTVVRVPVASSHFSTLAHDRIFLRWRLGGMDSTGRIHQDIAGGVIPIPFLHRKVAHAATLEFALPHTTMLCTLSVEAVDPDGARVAENFIQLFTARESEPAREELDRTLLLRLSPGQWTHAEWSGPTNTPEEAARDHVIYGSGHGFFEWSVPIDGINLRQARRLRILCEASARRVDTPQTTLDRFPTTLIMQLNEVPVSRQILINHPHDARGALSYLSGGKAGRGAYGYMVCATADGPLLAQIADQANGSIRLRCSVPRDELAVGGLTLYDTAAGRYPVSIVLLIDW